MFGYGESNAMGRHLHDLLVPARYREDYLRGLVRFGKTGVGKTMGGTLEVSAVRSDGREFPIELSLSALRLKGRWHGVGIVRDITERKRAEEKLRASLDLLQAIIENVPIRVFWKDRSLRFLGCNKAFALDAGKESPEELIGKDDYQMNWKDQAEIYRSDDRSVMDSDTPKIGYEEPQTTPQGNSIWLRTSKVPLHDAHGNVFGLLGIYDDITDRKRDHERLVKSLVDLAEAQQLAHIGSWSWDVPTDRISWSEEYYRICDREPGEPTPNYADHLAAYAAESASRLDASVKRALESGEPYALELELASGKWVLARGLAKFGESGKVAVLFGTAQDITERKQAEKTQKKLTRALTLLSRCNAVLIHAENEQHLFSEICRLAVETGGYLMAWVGFPEQDKTVRPVAQSGYEEAYLEKVDVRWDEGERGRGPTGTAIRTGEIQVNQNCLTNPLMAPWRESALKRGYQSSVALPLVHAGKILGALTLYASEPDAFDQ
ncbi:MAG TPA: PAS domain S-box protein, partial [Burkholderiales bacterium]|nr:PAS domain S-box protein [Burkholderiales bacterium]